jgi:hypothetical protein
MEMGEERMGGGCIGASFEIFLLPILISDIRKLPHVEILYRATYLQYALLI